MKAIELLTGGQTVTEKAKRYNDRIKDHLEIDILKLKEEIKSHRDEISECEDISLETDINRGIDGMTLETCKDRFDRISELTLQVDLLKVKLKVKESVIKKYF